MGILDIARRAANMGRTVADNTGIRTATVTLRTVTYDKAVGMAGASVVSTVDVVITPRPNVDRITDGTPSWFGGGTQAEGGGSMGARQYRIGPITPTFSGGGYSALDLLPSSSCSKRVFYILTGDDFASGGELFRPVSLDSAQALHHILTVERTAQ